MVNKEGNTFGKRYEKKYIVKKDVLTQFFKDHHEKITKDFSTDHYDQKSQFTIVNNIYFDSPGLNSYHDSIAKLPERHKLRIRSYAQNGVKEEFIFFEIKAKKEKQTIKTRIVMKEDWLNTFLEVGELPTRPLINLNAHQSKEKTLEIADQLSYFIHTLKYRPVIKSSYKRFAYKLRASGKLRLTVDTDLVISACSDKPICPHFEYLKMIDTDEMIVEVKYKDKEVLERLKDLKLILGESTSFSKYCFGIKQSQTVVPKYDIQQIHQKAL